jgi:hypothetical protein
MHLIFNADFFRHCNLNLYSDKLRSYLRYEKLAANSFSKEEIQTILEIHFGRTYVKLLIDALQIYQLTGKTEDSTN